MTSNPSVNTEPTQLPLVPSPAQWLATVMADFPSFLQDHASCEKKASGMALNVASHYPDRPNILSAMADLAVEELSHYREVVKLLISKGLCPSADNKDTYVRQFNAHVRRGSDHFLMDRLLVAAVIEARGHERFGLIAQALEAGPERRFYDAITSSEGRHWQIFVSLAEQEFEPVAVQQRLQTLLEVEATLMLQQPITARLH